MEESATCLWEVVISVIKNNKIWYMPIGALIVPLCALGARTGGRGFSVCSADFLSVLLWS